MNCLLNFFAMPLHTHAHELQHIHKFVILLLYNLCYHKTYALQILAHIPHARQLLKC